MEHNFDTQYELSRSKQRKTPCTIHSDLTPSLPAIQLLWHWFREFGTPSTADPFVDIFLYCHHLSAWYCIYYCKEKFFLGHSWELNGSITQILSFWRGLSMHGKVKNKGTYSKKIISIKNLKKLANFSKIWMDCYKCTGVSLVTLLKFKWSRAKCEKMK